MTKSAGTPLGRQTPAAQTTARVARNLFGALSDGCRVAAPQGRWFPHCSWAAALGLAYPAGHLLIKLKRGCGLSAAVITRSMVCRVGALVADGLDG